MIQGLFIGLPVATLQTMLSNAQSCLLAITTAHQSYSLAGRTFTRAQLQEVKDLIGEINYALNLASGGLQRTVYTDMSNS